MVSEVPALVKHSREQTGGPAIPSHADPRSPNGRTLYVWNPWEGSTMPLTKRSINANLLLIERLVKRHVDGREAGSADADSAGGLS